MAEKRIGLIPNATTMIRSGQAETCAVLVTDRRTIMAFDRPRRKGLKAGLKDMFGKQTDATVEPAKSIDYHTVDIDALARSSDNIVIPHAVIEKFMFRKEFGGSSTVFFEYLSEEGKKLAAYAQLSPPRELVKMRKMEGVPPKETKAQYALKCQEVFKRAFPPIVQAKAVWKS